MSKTEKNKRGLFSWEDEGAVLSDDPISELRLNLLRSENKYVFSLQLSQRRQVPHAEGEK